MKNGTRVKFCSPLLNAQDNLLSILASCCIFPYLNLTSWTGQLGWQKRSAMPEYGTCMTYYQGEGLDMELLFSGKGPCFLERVVLHWEGWCNFQLSLLTQEKTGNILTPAGAYTKCRLIANKPFHTEQVFKNVISVMMNLGYIQPLTMDKTCYASWRHPS